MSDYVRLAIGTVHVHCNSQCSAYLVHRLQCGWPFGEEVYFVLSWRLSCYPQFSGHVAAKIPSGVGSWFSNTHVQYSMTYGRERTHMNTCTYRCIGYGSGALRIGQWSWLRALGVQTDTCAECLANIMCCGSASVCKLCTSTTPRTVWDHATYYQSHVCVHTSG